MHSKEMSYSSIENIFSRLQYEFLTAVIGGQRATVDFATRISDLESQTALLNTNRNGTTGDGLFELAHKSSLGVATLASSFIDFEVEADVITAGLDTEIAEIFNSLSIDDKKDESYAILPETTSGLLTFGNPSRLGDVFKWILDNLHNPYPSMTTKRRLAKELCVPLKELNGTLSQTRRRIGWTSISKRHFQGNRQLTVDCATRILVESCGHLFYPNEIVRDFENMRDNAKNLLDRGSSRCRAEEVLGATPIGRSSGGLFRFSEGKRDVRPAIPNLSSRKRCRQVSDDDSELLCTRDSRVDHGRAVKRIRHLNYSKQPISRTASLSTSVSSRASTSELSTPNLPTRHLPVFPAEKSIDAWLSDIPVLDETGSFTGPEPEDCLRGFLFDSNPAIVEQDVPEDIFQILSQLDFTLPPPVSVGDRRVTDGDLLGWGELNEQKTGVLSNEPEMPIGTRKRRPSESNSVVSTKRPRLSNAGESCAEASPSSYLIAPSVHDTPLTYHAYPAHGLLSMLDFFPTSTSSLGDGPQASDDLQLSLYTYPSWDGANRQSDTNNPGTTSETPFEIAPDSEHFGDHIPLIVEHSSLLTQHPVNADVAEGECFAGTSVPLTPIATIDPSEDSLNSSIVETKEREDKLTGSSIVSPNLPEAGRIAKLERLNQLLNEAAKLQLEVFG